MGDDSTVETHANERTDTETETMTDFLEFAGRRARVGRDSRLEYWSGLVQSAVAFSEHLRSLCVTKVVNFCDKM